MSNLAKFEALLRRAAGLGADVRVVPFVNQDYGDVEFYAHIQGDDGAAVNVTLCNGPTLSFLDLQRVAVGMRGTDAAAISRLVESYSREPLKPDGS